VSSWILLLSSGDKFIKNSKLRETKILKRAAEKEYNLKRQELSTAQERQKVVKNLPVGVPGIIPQK